MKRYVLPKPNNKPPVRVNQNYKRDLTLTTRPSLLHLKPWLVCRANAVRPQLSPKGNEGSWTLTPMLAPDGAVWTTAEYQIDVELDVFLPRPLLSSLTGSNLPLALAAFKDRAERRIDRVGL